MSRHKKSCPNPCLVTYCICKMFSLACKRVVHTLRIVCNQNAPALHQMRRQSKRIGLPKNAKKNAQARNTPLLHAWRALQKYQRAARRFGCWAGFAKLPIIGSLGSRREAVRDNLRIGRGSAGNLCAQPPQAIFDTAMGGPFPQSHTKVTLHAQYQNGCS